MGVRGGVFLHVFHACSDTSAGISIGGSFGVRLVEELGVSVSIAAGWLPISVPLLI